MISLAYDRSTGYLRLPRRKQRVLVGLSIGARALVLGIFCPYSKGTMAVEHVYDTVVADIHSGVETVIFPLSREISRKTAVTRMNRVTPLTYFDSSFGNIVGALGIFNLMTTQESAQLLLVRVATEGPAR